MVLHLFLSMQSIESRMAYDLRPLTESMSISHSTLTLPTNMLQEGSCTTSHMHPGRLLPAEAWH